MFMWNVVLMMAVIEFLTLTVFRMDIEGGEGGDRLGICMVMVLTAIAFLQVVTSKLPNVPYLTFLDWYIYLSFLFLVAVTLETAIVHAIYHEEMIDDYAANKRDFEFFMVCLIYLLIYHVVFAVWAFYVRSQEKAKLVMDSDRIDDEVAHSRPVLQFENTKGMRQGDCDRLLFFKASKKVDKSKDGAKKSEQKGAKS